MKIIKYQKLKGNEYKIITDKEEYKLYDDIIIKHELLLKKEITSKEMTSILQENKALSAYYQALKYLSIKLRCAKELNSYLQKKGYEARDINYAIERLENDGYLNKKIYIEAYIHDMLTLNMVGEDKIYQDLIKLGFRVEEVKPYLETIDKNIYLEKINKYINKKVKSNKRSIKEFKRKILQELMTKGFKKEDILNVLETLEITENDSVIGHIIEKQYLKYRKKHDKETSILKIRSYLYQKGYENIDVEGYLENIN